MIYLSVLARVSSQMNAEAWSEWRRKILQAEVGISKVIAFLNPEQESAPGTFRTITRSNKAFLALEREFSRWKELRDEERMALRGRWARFVAGLPAELRTMIERKKL